MCRNREWAGGPAPSLSKGLSKGWYGGTLLFTFSLGFGLPFALIGTFAGWLKRGQVIARHVLAVEKLGGWALEGALPL
ncbi:MAG: hypothetical protein V3S14_06510 [Anaerolineae bacterium]